MKVKVYTINTTAGKMYGLVNANDGHVLYNATAKWKTAKGAETYAKKAGYTIAG
jgi:hypothetical protein